MEIRNVMTHDSNFTSLFRMFCLQEKAPCIYLSVEPREEGNGGEEELAERRIGVEEEDALQVEGGVLACNDRIQGLTSRVQKLRLLT